MDVDHPVAPRLDQTGIEQPQKAREANEVDPRCAKSRIGFGGKFGAVAMGDGRQPRMRAAAARARPAASARLLMTRAISAGYPGSAQASISACKFVPRPEINTPSRIAPRAIPHPTWREPPGPAVDSAAAKTAL